MKGTVNHPGGAMATYTQMAGLARKRRSKLENQISKAVDSIAAWKSEVKQLDTLVSSLQGIGGGKSACGPLKRARGGRRGVWKPGSRGRPPQWYLDQQEAKGAKGKRPAKRVAKPKPAKRKKRVSAKQLAGLARARAVLAAKRSAAKGSPSK
jgi:hypothetical protein